MNFDPQNMGPDNVDQWPIDNSFAQLAAELLEINFFHDGPNLHKFEFNGHAYIVWVIILIASYFFIFYTFRNLGPSKHGFKHLFSHNFGQIWRKKIYNWPNFSILHILTPCWHTSKTILSWSVTLKTCAFCADVFFFFWGGGGGGVCVYDNIKIIWKLQNLIKC